MKSTTYDTEQSIIAFLENLLTNYKQNKLTPEEKKRITEFYIKENFINSSLNTLNNEDNLMKYIVMGWHVYENLDKLDN